MKKPLKNTGKFLNYVYSLSGKYLNFWRKPGHYYSPIPSIKNVKRNKDKIYKYNQKAFPAINLNLEKQLELLNSFKKYKEVLWSETPDKKFRYYYKNNYFAKTDADILYYMIKEVKPQKIIEVGSGFSSALILDTNQTFFQNRIQLSFIEPYPLRLKSLLRKEDKNINLIEKTLQDAPFEIFSELNENDILFIDSSHVSKTGSDVNYIFFEILPNLKSGVYVHFHDIMHPFEYPEKWVYEARAWNEIYTLRAFLQYNNSFDIILFNSYLWYFYRDFLMETFNFKEGGGSFWIRKK